VGEQRKVCGSKSQLKQIQLEQGVPGYGSSFM